VVNLSSSWFVQCPVCYGSVGICGGVDSHIEVIEERMIEIEMDHYLEGLLLGMTMGVELVQAELERVIRRGGQRAGLLQALGYVDAMRAAMDAPDDEPLDTECVEESLCIRCPSSEGDECDCSACAVRHA